MRGRPVAYVAPDEQECLALAEESAAVIHNHPEGVKGAQAAAWATWAAFVRTVSQFDPKRGRGSVWI